MPYNIATITRGLQDQFNLFQRDPRAQPKNTATPERIGVLLASLRKLTEQVEAHRDEFSMFVPDASLPQWDADMAAWKDRLGIYQAAVAAAPRGDRWPILWDVTAPLLLGYYGGVASFSAQKPLDAVTPFSLANQLDVADSWRAERLRLFWADLATNLRNLPGDVLAKIWDVVPWWVWAAAGTAGVVLVGTHLHRARRRNPNVLLPSR